MGVPFRSSIVALALLCISAIPSHAVSVALGSVLPGEVVTDQATFQHTNFSGEFDDTFYFQLLGPVSFTTKVSLNSAIGGIDPFTLQVFQLGGSTPILETNSILTVGSAEFLTVAGVLSAGTYFIKVFGTA